MNCKHCRQQHPSYNSYCPTTGQYIDDLGSHTYTTHEFCVNCGTHNENYYVHCTNCGTHLLKVEEPKQKITKIISQNIPNIPFSSETITKHMNTTQLKSVSKENIEYIKNNRFMFVPVLITILLVIAFGFFAKNPLNEMLEDIGKDSDSVETKFFFSHDEVKEQLEDYYDINVDIPPFPVVSTAILFAHNANYSINFYGEIDEGYGDDSIELEGKLENLTYSMTIITILIFAIGAIVYGILAKKEKWHFGKGILFSTVAYSIFIFIILWLGRYKMKLEFDEDMLTGEIISGFTPHFISTLFSSALLFAVFFTIFGYIAYNWKNLISSFQSLSHYIQYAVYALGITVTGLFVHTISSFMSIRKEGGISDLPLDLNAFSEYTGNFILSTYMGVMNWNANLFGKLAITLDFDYTDNSMDYKWFMNSGSDGREARNIIEDILLLPPVIYMLLLIALIGYVGYLTLSKHQLNLKQIAIFSGIFTIIQFILVFFTTVMIEIDGPNFFSISLTYSYMNTLFGSFILAFAAIYGGGYLRQYLKK